MSDTTDHSTTTDDTHNTNIGVITTIETPTGDRIDTQDINPDDRKDWCDAITDTIKTLNGIDEVFLAGLSARNQSATFEVTVESTDTDHTSNVTITTNLRRIAQKLRNTVKDFAVVSSYELVDSPIAVDAQRNQYETNYYIIDVWLV
ncbi:hypothetical protein [Salinibaculum rarum]|uniref:hypothetical protein n=1 Tax=Salinibaculum rarum TaxID=3058903 RepID=UPI00265D8A0C|nr:hypothetical protein [Salinibaculum sp. KK48]